MNRGVLVLGAGFGGLELSTLLSEALGEGAGLGREAHPARAPHRSSAVGLETSGMPAP